MKKQNDLNFKRLLVVFIVVFLAIVIFTLFDYLIHSISDGFSVPDRYFRNKIIYGTLIGFVAYFFIRKFNPINKALIFSAAVAILLQIRYLLEGYSIKFVLLFLGIHFIVLSIVSWVAFEFTKI